MKTIKQNTSRSTAPKMDVTTFKRICELTTTAGKTWYSIVGKDKLYALSSKKYAMAEQLLADIDEDTTLSVWYYDNGPFCNICGISADFDAQNLPF